MKLARVLAKQTGKLADTVTAPIDTAASTAGSAGQQAKPQAYFSGRTASESAGSSGRCAHLGMHALLLANTSKALQTESYRLQGGVLELWCML